MKKSKSFREKNAKSDNPKSFTKKIHKFFISILRTKDYSGLSVFGSDPLPLHYLAITSPIIIGFVIF